MIIHALRNYFFRVLKPYLYNRKDLWLTMRTITKILFWKHQSLFPQRKPFLRNHFWTSQKLKSSPVRIFYVGKNACPPCWRCTKSLLHLWLWNLTQARLRNKLMFGSKQTRYIVTPYSVHYLTICSMFIALTRKQKIFGIFLSSNTLPKMSSDKGSWLETTTAGRWSKTKT